MQFPKLPDNYCEWLKSIINEKYLPMFESMKRFNILWGSAGSGKSKAVYKKIIFDCWYLGCNILIIRKTAHSHQLSTWQECKMAIEEMQLSPFFDISADSTKEINCRYIKALGKKFKNKGEIRFIGCDDVEKLKSISDNVDVIVLEEATELSYDDFEQIDMRLRGHSKVTGNKRFYIMFNPIDANHWLKTEVFDSDRFPEKLVIHSTYKDNKYLDQNYINTLESKTGYMRDVYVLGNWGNFEGKIFKDNYSFKNISQNLEDYSRVYGGIDWGWNHLSAFGVIGIRKSEPDNIYILQDLGYKSLVTKQFGEKIQENVDYIGLKMFADSAEPDRIAEFADYPFNFDIEAVKKGKGSLAYGIDFLNSKQLILHPSCIELKKELDGYKYKQDKKTGKWSKEPLEVNDDRIATEEIKEGQGIAIKDIPKAKMIEIRNSFKIRNEI